jgi:hypothetical protein
MIAAGNRELEIAIRYRLAMLSLLFRYLICLYWMGVITAFSMAAILIRESVLIPARLLSR